jgi:hypothetical protein
MRQKASWIAAASIALAATLASAWYVRRPVKVQYSSATETRLPQTVVEPATTGASSPAVLPPTAAPHSLEPASAKPSKRESAAVAANPAPIAEVLRREWNESEVDRAASDKWTRHFSEALDELNIDGELSELQCTKTLCRIDFHFSNVAEALRFQSAAGIPERRRGIEITMTDNQVDVEVLLAAGDTPDTPQRP